MCLNEPFIPSCPKICCYHIREWKSSFVKCLNKHDFIVTFYTRFVYSRYKKIWERILFDKIIFYVQVGNINVKSNETWLVSVFENDNMTEIMLKLQVIEHNATEQCHAVVGNVGKETVAPRWDKTRLIRLNFGPIYSLNSLNMGYMLQQFNIHIVDISYKIHF